MSPGKALVAGVGIGAGVGTLAAIFKSFGNGSMEIPGAGRSATIGGVIGGALLLSAAWLDRNG